jgi:hemolysin activation/secretion protein
VTLGLDYKHFRNTISLDSSGATQHAITTIQPISYVNASIAYNGAWQRLESGTAQQTGSFDVTFNGGPRGLANATENFGATRFMARGNYAYLRSDAAFTTRLPAGMLLTVRASGQAAQDPLVEYEQYSITGSDGVRGYLEAEVLSDSAVKGTLQLQSPPVSTSKFLLGDGFLFFDAGRSHAIDALPGEQEHISLRSFGAGLDLFPGHSVTGTLTIADPLLPGPRTKSHEPRVLFDVKGAF